MSEQNENAAAPETMHDPVARAEKAERERDEYLNLAKQVKADFDNYQKRNQRDLAQERRFALSPLAVSLFPAMDNLDRAMTAAKESGETGPLVQGVAMVQAQLLDVLRRHGITRIEAQDKPFDPNQHQAVSQAPSDKHPPMTVLQVLEQGYQLHDRILRPASVIVSTAPQTAPN